MMNIIPNKEKNYQFNDDYYSMDDCCHDLEHRNADHYEEDDYYFEEWGDY